MVTRTRQALVLAATLALFALPLAPAARADNPPAELAERVSAELVEQAQAKLAVQDYLHADPAIVRSRLGEAVDPTQVSIAGPIERGILKLTAQTQAAYAYVQPYREPDDWAHRNYCGAGAAVTLLSHWDTNLPNTVDIDQLGREMGLDPDTGVWIYRIARPVNERLNQYLGQDVNWYRFANAASLDDLRWMIEVDIKQNAVPFVTGLMTYGLPGWGPRNVGHIVCVYGYTRDPDGAEWVAYTDTSPPVSGYHGYILHNIELGWFWQAVSGNSAQVW